MYERREGAREIASEIVASNEAEGMLKVLVNLKFLSKSPILVEMLIRTIMNIEVVSLRRSF